MLGSVSMNAVLYASCSVRIGRKRDMRSDEPVRIILGWDGSAGAVRASEIIGLRHWPAGSKLRIVTSIDDRLASAAPSDLSAGIVGSALTMAVGDPGDSLEQSAAAVAERLRGRSIEVETPVFRDGDPKRVLLDEASQWNADCIVVGAKGLSRIARGLLGSVAASVASRATCSVEIIRPPG